MASNIKGIVTIEQNTQATLCSVSFNPFAFIISLGIVATLNAFIQQEQILFPDSNHDSFRRSLSSDTPATPVGISTRDENREFRTLDNSPSSTAIQILSRGTRSVSMVLLIFIPTIVFAFADLPLRYQFTNKLLYTGRCPKFTSELFKKIRTGNCGALRIAYSLVLAPFQALVNANNYSNSFIDPSFLVTEAGQLAIVSIWSQISNSPSNYVPFINVTREDIPAPPAGSTITQTALVSRRGFGQIDSTVCVLPGNSLPAQIPTVHLSDAALFNGTATLYTTDDENNTTAELFQTLALPSFQLRFTTSDNLIQYIVMRVTGIVDNPGKFKKPSPNGSPSREETPNRESDSPFSDKTLPTGGTNVQEQLPKFKSRTDNLSVQVSLPNGLNLSLPINHFIEMLQIRAPGRSFVNAS